MKNQLIKHLLESNAFSFSPNDFFTWASGMKSPIYCDNRILLSIPEARNVIIESFVKYIKNECPTTEIIAGVATSGIPYASIVASELKLPLVYVRNQNKSHGQKNKIEGILPKRKNIILIEDLISTGQSSLNAAQSLLDIEGNILKVLSIFSYGLKQSYDFFSEKNLSYHSLLYLKDLVKYGFENKIIKEKDIDTINNWIEDFK